MFAADVEDRIEALCLAAEQMKPYLEARWNGHPPGSGCLENAAVDNTVPEKLEVLS